MNIKNLFIRMTDTDGLNAVSTKRLAAFAKKLEDAKHPRVEYDFYNPQPEDDTEPSENSNDSSQLETAS